MTTQRSRARRYDVAISFAGEDRDTAREFARLLTKAKYSVFFDEFAQAELLGEDLTSKLQEIYSKDARHCVMLISRHYAKKPWTVHERRSALSRALTERRAYVLPVRLYDTPLPGLPEVIGYLDLRVIRVAEAVAQLKKKMGPPAGPARPRDRGAHTVTRDRVREVLSLCYRRAIFAHVGSHDTSVSTAAMFASLASCRSSLQRLVVYVEPEELQRIVAAVVGELDFIERHNPRLTGGHFTTEFRVIHESKLRIIALLSQLSEAAAVPFVLPTSVTAEELLDQSQADAPPVGPTMDPRLFRRRG